jgi:hypothetical protein
LSQPTTVSQQVKPQRNLWRIEYFQVRSTVSKSDCLELADGAKLQNLITGEWQNDFQSEAAQSTFNLFSAAVAAEVMLKILSLIFL